MVPLPQASEQSRNKRVLVVDDSHDSAEMLCEVLQTYGCEACVAYDGASALEAAQSFKPEVALIDINLPEMDGCELARRLRQMPELSEARLIAVTGYSEASERRRCEEAGFNAYMVKPVDLKSLRSLISR